MKHPSSRLVLNYWQDKRRNRPAPERADIDPGGIRAALGDAFMLSADFAGELRFRLAGTRVCALFCREVKGESFVSVWAEQSRPHVAQLLRVVTDESVGLVMGLAGTTADGIELPLEMLVLPLLHSGQTRIRALGVLAPVTPPYWLGEKPLVELALRTLRHLRGDADEPRLPQAPQRRHGLVVYRGGRHGVGERIV
jgi:hypothetical protein